MGRQVLNLVEPAPLDRRGRVHHRHGRLQAWMAVGHDHLQLLVPPVPGPNATLPQPRQERLPNLIAFLALDRLEVHQLFPPVMRQAPGQQQDAFGLATPSAAFSDPFTHPAVLGVQPQNPIRPLQRTPPPEGQLGVDLCDDPRDRRRADRVAERLGHHVDDRPCRAAGGDPRLDRRLDLAVATGVGVPEPRAEGPLGPPHARHPQPQDTERRLEPPAFVAVAPAASHGRPLVMPAAEEEVAFGLHHQMAPVHQEATALFAALLPKRLLHPGPIVR
ncbi:hypothetical protein ES708_30440 [subsurface metagenome]